MRAQAERGGRPGGNRRRRGGRKEEGRVPVRQVVLRCPRFGGTGDGVEVQITCASHRAIFISDPDSTRCPRTSSSSSCRGCSSSTFVALVVTMSVRVTEEPQTVVNIEAMRCVVEGRFRGEDAINDRLRSR